MPTLHAACRPRSSSAGSGPAPTADSIAAGLTGDNATATIEDALQQLQQVQQQQRPADLQQQRQQQPAVVSVLLTTSSSFASSIGIASSSAAGSGLASRLQGLRGCVADSATDPIPRPAGFPDSSSSVTDSNSTAGSSGSGDAARFANLAVLVPSCLGAVLFRQQQVVVRPGGGWVNCSSRRRNRQQREHRGCRCAGGWVRWRQQRQWQRQPAAATARRDF